MSRIDSWLLSCVRLEWVTFQDEEQWGRSKLYGTIRSFEHIICMISKISSRHPSVDSEYNPDSDLKVWSKRLWPHGSMLQRYVTWAVSCTSTDVRKCVFLGCHCDTWQIELAWGYLNSDIPPPRKVTWLSDESHTINYKEPSNMSHERKVSFQTCRSPNTAPSPTWICVYFINIWRFSCRDQKQGLVNLKGGEMRKSNHLLLHWSKPEFRDERRLKLESTDFSYHTELYSLTFQSDQDNFYYLRVAWKVMGPTWDFILGKKGTVELNKKQKIYSALS